MTATRVPASSLSPHQDSCLCVMMSGQKAMDYQRPDYQRPLTLGCTSGGGIGLAEACRARMEVNRERCFGWKDAVYSGDIPDSCMVCIFLLDERTFCWFLAFHIELVLLWWIRHCCVGWDTQNRYQWNANAFYVSFTFLMVCLLQGEAVWRCNL